MKLLQEFKTFISRGNVIDLAIGVIIGGSFGKIVTSLVEDIIMPSLGILINGVNFGDLKIVLAPSHKVNGKMIDMVSINYGIFLQNSLNFLIIAACIFALVKVLNNLKHEERKQEVKEQKKIESPELIVLKEVRDILAKNVKHK